MKGLPLPRTESPIPMRSWAFSTRVNEKRISRNVYAKTLEECEEKLAELIKTMKAEIAEMKKAAKNA